MVRATILYEREPESERYAQHNEEFSNKVDCKAFRHGKAFGAPMGEPAFAYYAEFEWDDMEAFKAAAQSEEFAASGKDAMAMGIPFTVTLVELA
ncbi:MAG: hypothetical protein ACXWZB_10110 [Gaiellaceae bacterium]